LTQCSYQSTGIPENALRTYAPSNQLQKVYVTNSYKEEQYIGEFVTLTCKSEYCMNVFKAKPKKDLKILCQCKQCVDEENPLGKPHAHEKRSRDYFELGHYGGFLKKDSKLPSEGSLRSSLESFHPNEILTPTESSDRRSAQFAKRKRFANPDPLCVAKIGDLITCFR
jgi:hypothetical protein